MRLLSCIPCGMRGFGLTHPATMQPPVLVRKVSVGSWRWSFWKSARLGPRQTVLATTQQLVLSKKVANGSMRSLSCKPCVIREFGLRRAATVQPLVLVNEEELCAIMGSMHHHLMVANDFPQATGT